jgi:hypothetical protein
MDGLQREFLKDPVFSDIVTRDLEDGQHRNPASHPGYFMDTFFHHPDELRAEVSEAGFAMTVVYGIVGPAWLAANLESGWEDEQHRHELLRIARALESEPTLLGVSAHLMAVGTKV